MGKLRRVLDIIQACAPDGADRERVAGRACQADRGLNKPLQLSAI